MGSVIPRAWLCAVVVGVLVLCGGVGAYALDAGATRASGGSSRPHSIAWLSPRDGSTLRGSLRGSSCAVTVHDSNPVTKVTFGLDGSTLTTDTAPPDTCRISVTVQGDSLTVGSWRRIPAYLGPKYDLVSYSAHWGRPSFKGLAQLRRQRLGRVVVFALGTNDWWAPPRVYRRHLTSVLQMIGPGRCLVVPTIWREGPSRALNAILRSMARRYGPARIQLARWSEAVASGRVRLSPDGTHPDTEAAWNGRAAIVASAIRTCAAS